MWKRVLGVSRDEDDGLAFVLELLRLRFLDEVCDLHVNGLPVLCRLGAQVGFGVVPVAWDVDALGVVLVAVVVCSRLYGVWGVVRMSWPGRFLGAGLGANLQVVFGVGLVGCVAVAFGVVVGSSSDVEERETGVDFGRPRCGWCVVCVLRGWRGV